MWLSLRTDVDYVTVEHTLEGGATETHSCKSLAESFKDKEVKVLETFKGETKGLKYRLFHMSRLRTAHMSRLPNMLRLKMELVWFISLLPSVQKIWMWRKNTICLC